MRGAQWVIDQIGGYDGPDAKKLARRMSAGIKRTTNEPTAEHVYNAAQFHYGEILRKHSPGMDRPEVYADMRKQLRAHLGLGEVNEDLKSVSKKIKNFALAGLVGAGAGSMIGPHLTPPGSSPEERTTASGRWAGIGSVVGNTVGLGQLSADALMASGALGSTIKRRRRLANESALNFINGLKRLTETSDALKQKLIDARFEQGWTAAKDGDKLFHEYMGQDPETGKPGKKGEGYGDPALLAVRDIRRKEMKKAWASSDKAKNRLKGRRGDGSPR